MIIVDTSALMAVLLKEPQAETCLRIFADQDTVGISAATLAEALVVADRRGIGDQMRAFLEDLPLHIYPMDADFAERVAETYSDWGRGVHPAGLNLLDCHAYALAAQRALPLLYVGNDFSRTDITPAIPRPN
jgi:ribonuclease VapC